MIKKYIEAVGRTIKLERDVDTIIRNAKLNVSDLIEAGLISLATEPGTRNDKLRHYAIRMLEDKLVYYAQLLEELKKIQIVQLSQPDQECRAVSDPVPAPAPKKFYNLEERILVKNKECPSDGKYFVTRPQYERQKDILEICKDDDES